MKYLYILGFSFLFVLACSKTSTDAVIQSTDLVMAKTDKEVFRSSAPEPGPARKIQIGKAESFELDNGLTVIVAENHKIPRVGFQLTLKNEPIIEGNQKGYVSFAGDLMSRGTSTRTKAEIDESIDFIGASFNTFSSGFFASSLTKHSEALLDIVTEVLYNPSFPEEELEKMRTQTLSGLETQKTDPGSMASNVTTVVNYGTNHPYGEVQTIESTKAITLQKCKDYYDRFFIPNNAYLTIVGDITSDEAREKAKKYFGKWRKKPFKPVVNKKVARASERKLAFAHKEGAVQSEIRITHPINLEPGHPDIVRASLMNTILGGGSSARLFQNLREDKAYTYGAYSSLSSDPVVGSFGASASVRNEVTDSSITEFLVEIGKIRDALVTEEELQSMKNYRTGSFGRAMESPQTIARFALNTIRYNLPADYYETYLERMNAVTPDEIMEMARKYVHPDNANIVVVGDKDAVAKNLIRFDSNGKIDYYDAFGREVEYSLVVPADATAESVISDYLDAIGGHDKIKSVKTLQTKMSSEMMGQSIEMNMKQKSPDKFSLVVGSGAMVFKEQKFNGEKAMQSCMGQKQVFTEGSQFEAMKGQAVIFPQINYLAESYEINLKGVENVEGMQCYKINIKDQGGKSSTEYYGLENSLLVRSITTQEAMGQKVTVTTDFSDYFETDGISFPGLTKISGAMPMTIEMKVEEIIVNGEIGDELFEIE